MTRFNEGMTHRDCLSKDGTFGRCLESQRQTMIRFIEEKIKLYPGQSIIVPKHGLHVHDGSHNIILSVEVKNIEIQDFKDSSHRFVAITDLDLASLSVVADFVDWTINHDPVMRPQVKPDAEQDTDPESDTDPILDTEPGRSTILPTEEERKLAVSGEFRDAIKLYANRMDCGLFFAKEVIEAYLRETTLANDRERGETYKAAIKAMPDINMEEREFIEEGRKVQAIKSYRTRTLFGLKESKDKIDKCAETIK